MNIMQTLGAVATLIVVVALVDVIVRQGSQAAELVKQTGQAFSDSIAAAKK